MSLPLTSGRGFVISDVELKFLGNGKPVANFAVAFKDSKKNDQGGWDDVRNTVFRLTAWDKLAEQINDSVNKLTEVDVTFKGYEDEYTKDGETKKSLKGTVVSCSPSLPKRDGQGGGQSFGGGQKSAQPSNDW